MKQSLVSEDTQTFTKEAVGERWDNNHNQALDARQPPTQSHLMASGSRALYGETEG